MDGACPSPYGRRAPECRSLEERQGRPKEASFTQSARRSGRNCRIPVSSVRDDSLMEETIIKAVCALLGLAVFVGNRLRERRERRAAAVVVLGVLREALSKTHEPHMHPVRTVIPFASYAEVWSTERKALAGRMTDEEFSAAESAFAALASL